MASVEHKSFQEKGRNYAVVRGIIAGIIGLALKPELLVWGGDLAGSGVIFKR